MNKQELIEELSNTKFICGIEISAEQKRALKYVAIRMEQLDEIDCNQKDQRIAELEKYEKWFNEVKERFIDGHEYSENPFIETLEQINDFRWCDETGYKERIAELEKEKQTAVKEFADKLIKMLNTYSIKGTIKICDNVLKNNINLLLKERGIE